MNHVELIAALVEIPERELVEVLNRVFSVRKLEVADHELEEARLLVAEAHRFREEGASWELLLLSRPVEPGEYCTEGSGPTQEASCCGFTLAAYAKNIVCPICGNPVDAT